MRSLSVLFLFVALAFLMYSSMMYGATQNAPSGGLLGGGGNPAKTSRIVSRSLEVLNLTVSNGSAVVRLMDRLTDTSISYEELLNTVEAVAKAGLLVVALSAFLLVTSSLVVR